MTKPHEVPVDIVRALLCERCADGSDPMRIGEGWYHGPHEDGLVSECRANLVLVYVDTWSEV